jgi:hypothetical protein
MKPLVWLTEQLNKHWLHIAVPLVMPSGSGDTSFAWANLTLSLLLATTGALVWTLIARRRQHMHLHCVYLRYVLAFISFSYGFQKLFALQMPFPNMSQLATPPSAIFCPCASPGCSLATALRAIILHHRCAL